MNLLKNKNNRGEVCELTRARKCFFRHGVTRESGQECMSAACIPRMHMHLIKRAEQGKGSLGCGSRVQVHGGLEGKGWGGRADPR